MYTVWMSTNAYMNGNLSKLAEDKEDETIPKKVMPGCVGISLQSAQMGYDPTYSAPRPRIQLDLSK